MRAARGFYGLHRLPGGYWWRLYDCLVPLAVVGAGVAAAWNGRLRSAIRQRRNPLDSWRFHGADLNRTILIHVASAGEFEAARPVVERLVGAGDLQVAVSYFSPSARATVEATPGLWAHGFLPLDRLVDQLGLLGRLAPELILIFKHDFWPNMLRAAKFMDIPVGLVCANFHERSRRYRGAAKLFHREVMKNLTFVWTVSDADRMRVMPLLGDGTELKVGGDTRYDRVLARAETGRVEFAPLADALGPGRIIVAGSTWRADEHIVWEAFQRLKALYGDLKLILAPHEPGRESLRRNRELAAAAGLAIMEYSEWKGGGIEADCVLVDVVGILGGLYALGWAAHVGGGFGGGVHSVIEPAACGLPVTFGPRHHVSHEAGLLIEAGGGFSVSSADELAGLWREWMSTPAVHQHAAAGALEVVAANSGAVDRLIAKVESVVGRIDQPS